MLVKFLHSIAGNDYKYGKGEEVDLPDNIAMKFINTGNAVVYDSDLPKGIQKPKRKPIVDIPEVHTTIIKKKPKVRKKRAYKKKK